MPATSGDPARRRSRRDQPREWTGLDTAHGFERCVRATLRELYGYVALLTGRDRREAERLVSDVYRSLFRAAQAGHVGSVTLGALRSAGRRTWLDAHRDELAAIDEVSTAPASTIAELSMLERAVLVLRFVNGMSVERAAAELGRSERDVSVLSSHSVRRLRGTDDTTGAWLRAYLGPSVTPSAGLVDRIVRQLGDDVAPPTGELPTADLTVAALAGEDVPAGAGDGAGDDDGVPPEATPSTELPTELPTVELEAVDPEAVDRSDAGPADGDGVGDDTEARRDDAASPDDLPADDLPADELPTSELAVVDRPTVEIPSVVPPAAPPADPAAEPAADAPPVGGTPAMVGADPEDGPGRSRPGWVVAVGALLVAALVVALVWLALRGDTGDTAESAPAAGAAPSATSAAEGTAGSAPATDVPATTVPATTVPATTVPAGPVDVGLDPACAERVGDQPRTIEWSDTLGPLAAEPALVLTLPESVDVAAEPDRAPARTSVILRSDGAIVTARAATPHRATSTMVSRVGLDGTVAWVRCVAGDAAVASQPDVGVDLAFRPAGDATEWVALELADGAVGEPLDAVQSAVLDAAVPTDASNGRDDGPTLGFSYDSGLQRTVPAGLDGGRVIWTASDVVLPEAGAFRATTAGDVVLAQSCVDTDGTLDCAAGELRAFDLATGDLLWSRPGEHAVAATGDDVALVGDGSGWELVDVATGEVVDGQRWDDPDAFAVDPTDEASFVAQHGGAVVVARSGVVSVWLPVDVDVTPTAIGLP